MEILSLHYWQWLLRFFLRLMQSFPKSVMELPKAQFDRATPFLNLDNLLMLAKIYSKSYPLNCQIPSHLEKKGGVW